ncbi:MAG: M67 family metallopeptidase [Anaerolineae bacterium]|nr:M67 family metallopeptidase [Anaerolineae bacterium]
MAVGDEVVLGIPGRIVEAMQAQVEAHPGEEVCGLLGGKNGQVRAWLPVENELHQHEAYRMEPQAMVNALARLEAQGLDLLAIYHSHPCGPAVPSQRDIAEFAWPGVLTLIWAPVGSAWDLSAYHISGDECLAVTWLRVEPAPLPPDGG